ncbi:Potassium voltage-gated channel protein Shaker [Diplonema papillatum]|nr:Potassium voltage-gated channel protein Shaker [Diplonema papillatum]
MEEGEGGAEAEPSEPPMTLRHKIYALLDPGVPAATPMLALASTVISISVFVLIYLSIMVFCIESHPKFYKKNNVVLSVIETLCVVVFTLEFLLKLVTVESKLSFFKSFLNWIDFVSILPFYLELFVTRLGGAGFSMNSFVFLRVIRLARVFRVFKLGKYSTGLQLVIHAMRQSSEALSLLGFLLGIALVLFASLIFIAEQSEASFNAVDQRWEYNWNDTLTGKPVPSDFQSIPDSFWWALVTLATVGYGDQVPHTWFGKAVGITCMIVGVLVLAFPIILISNNFSDAVREFNEQQRQDEGTDVTATTQSDDAGSVTPHPECSAGMIEMKARDPVPQPSPYTVVGYFRYSGRMRCTHFVNSINASGSEIMHFRYEPVFTVPLNKQGIVETVATVEHGIGQYLLQFDIVLDSPEVQDAARQAIGKLGLFGADRLSRANITCYPFSKVAVSIPLLGSDCLLTKEYRNPGSTLGIVLSAKTKEELEAIQSRIPVCTVRCTCTRRYSNAVDMEVTIPLLVSSATRAGIQNFEQHEND